MSPDFLAGLTKTKNDLIMLILDFSSGSDESIIDIYNTRKHIQPFWNKTLELHWFEKRNCCKRFWDQILIKILSKSDINRNKRFQSKSLLKKFGVGCKRLGRLGKRKETFLAHQDEVRGSLLYPRGRCRSPDLVKVFAEGPVSKLLPYFLGYRLVFFFIRCVSLGLSPGIGLS